jgi:signal-transduction protein with cAMP-binding, CBS, and nucleotidyltransferase domain
MSTESREELLAFLRRHPPYKDMGAFALDALAAALKPVTVADGGQILTPSDMPPDLYIIESGQVQVRQVGDVTLTDPPLYGLGARAELPAGGDGGTASGDQRL